MSPVRKETTYSSQVWRSAGMLVDLHLYKGPGYNIMNMSFFITYVALQPLMILICRKVGPRIFLPREFSHSHQELCSKSGVLTRCSRLLYVGRNHRGLRLREELANDGASSTSSWYPRGWLFPRVSVFDICLVSEMFVNASWPDSMGRLT